MAKVLVAYYSRSGNTKKMAEIISVVLKDQGLQIELKDVSETKAEELINYDVIVFGSPTYYGSMAYQIKKLIDESVKLHGKLEGKIGAAFSSAGNVAGGNETTIAGILNAFLIHGMIVQGDSRGDHYGPVSLGLPEERAIKECQRFAKRLAVLANKLFD
ncbi:MAG: NAD(P)H-dependent oxidoreductase [Candidatus Omnitrophica bacterium]|nr:NAD(P)H-dependent oxidoreductase [Candidatus Omnitrophota bacterium]